MPQRVSTGISGLDEILHGGLIPAQAYLIRGGPGTGKTTLGLHFLSVGVARGEQSLFITLGEPEAQLRRNAQSLGLDLNRVNFLDLSPSSEFFIKVQTYDIFSPAEVEREPITQKIIEQVHALQPQRIFLDAITQFRYLSTDAFQFHKQVLSFLRFLLEQEATVLFTSEGHQNAPDDDLQFISDSVIHLDNSLQGRRLQVSKFRGSGFRSGQHSMRLTNQGIEVFPFLLPEKHKREFTAESISSGIPEIDELLHGGIERGTVTIISGPSGVGKTSLGLQFMKEAAGRGERSVIYLFEESRETLLHRCEAINIPVNAMLERSTLSIISIEPLQYTADQLAYLVRQEVEQAEAKLIMLDSTSGYRLSLRGENLVRQLHSLCQYAKNMGVTIILINETEVIAGNEFRVTEVGLSYLADNLIFLRYLELQGQIRKAIGVLKKRVSDFERNLREYEITRYGLKVGEPLTGLRGILRGVPEFIDSRRDD